MIKPSIKKINIKIGIIATLYHTPKKTKKYQYQQLSLFAIQNYQLTQRFQRANTLSNATICNVYLGGKYKDNIAFNNIYKKSTFMKQIIKDTHLILPDDYNNIYVDITPC
jgi:hypothetical protein